MEVRNNTLEPSEIGKVDYHCVLAGTVLSMGISVFLLAAFAFILQFTEFPATLMEPAVRVSTLLGPLAGGILAVRRICSYGWLNGGAVGLACILFLYILGGIAGKNFSVGPSMLTMMALSVFAGALGGIIGINTKSKN